MARIPTLHEDDPGTSAEAREFLRRVQRGFGEVFNSIRLFANSPRAANAVADFARSVRHHNSLTPELTELAYTTGSITNGCYY